MKNTEITEEMLINSGFIKGWHLYTFFQKDNTIIFLIDGVFYLPAEFRESIITQIAVS